jgi:AraC-like DNA-binding protein
MQRRTLSRRLQAEGATFEGILDEIRSQAAREFLRHTEMSIAQISSVVGYADVSAFTRAFRRWTGATPAQWRSSQGTTSDRADG